MSIDLEKVDLMGRINSLEILGTRYATRIRELEAALRDVMPLLDECDCIYSDREAPLCPCRAARAALAGESK